MGKFVILSEPFKVALFKTFRWILFKLLRLIYQGNSLLYTNYVEIWLMLKL